MAEILTNIQEPGFFSKTTVSPELFLNPTKEQVVALIGTGRDYKNSFKVITRGTLNADIIGAAYNIKSINKVSIGDSPLGLPVTTYRLATVASSDINSSINGKILKFSINGTVYQYTITATNPVSILDLVTEINSANIGITAFRYGSTNMIGFYATNGGELKFLDGDINPLIGIPNNSFGNAIFWISSAPASGDSLTISFSLLKEELDFSPKFFYDANDVYAEYGSDMGLYSLSAGAYGAFAGGAYVVVCVQVDPILWDSGDSGKKTAIENALKKLEPYYVSIIVPMDPVNTDTSKISYYLDHVSKMSSKLERKERIAILSVDERQSKIAINDWQSLMGAFNVPASSGRDPKRVMVLHPGSAFVTYNGITYNFDGSYNAAVLAGMMVSRNYDEATSMTRKVMPTISSFVSEEYTRSEKNLLTSYGVTVLEMKDGIALIRRSLTADGSSIANQEPSIVRSFDRVAKELRDGLEKEYVGTKINSSTVGLISSSVSKYLDVLVYNEIISGYRNISVKQNKLEPRQIDVRFEASPVYVLLWGLIDISITL